MKQIKFYILFIILTVLVLFVVKQIDFNNHEDKTSSIDIKEITFSEEELRTQKKLDNYLIEIESIKSNLKNIYDFKYDSSKNNFELIREQMPIFLLSLNNADTQKYENKILEIYAELNKLMLEHNVYHNYDATESKIIISANIDKVIVKCSYLFGLLEINKSEIADDYFIENNELNDMQKKRLISQGDEKHIAQFMYELYFSR